MVKECLGEKNKCFQTYFRRCHDKSIKLSFWKYLRNKFKQEFKICTVKKDSIKKLLKSGLNTAFKKAKDYKTFS